MSPSPESSLKTRRPPAPEPLRRKRVQPAPFSAFRRKPFQILLGFVTLVLLIDALVGERGLVERMKVRRQFREQAAALEAKKQENARLRELARRYAEDPSAIESLAREELGLLRPGELLFIIRDAKPAQ
jgi:cell division protein FtsB